MSDGQTSDAENVGDRMRRIEKLLASVRRRLQTGEGIFSESIIAGHEDLMPELGEKLRQLMRVEVARQHAAQETNDRATANESERIGPFKLLQQIGEGGMGTVWMAEQEQPVRRRVALKLIKAGQDSRKVIARFEAERQALAMMDHPHIAKVLDVGAADDGRPYFVMELVQGDPITKYCDQNKLTPRQRLELFVPVCEAIQHAHHKGIIHRDLKPSNVLVHIYDGKPMAKVIDFGLAKALQHQTKLTDKTVFTEFGQVVGTVQYMSPEQARLDAIDVDTRTDIYSLGVILYELLAGSTPIERKTLEQTALLQVLEIIRDEEPPPPSRRLSSSIDKLESISDQRRTKPVRLHQILCGDLDWIVMKALEKDRTRRYSTAHDFADDLGCYLGGDVVKARPPTVVYRVRKFVKKHRVLVASSTIIAGLLIAGIAGTSWFALEAQRHAEIAFEKEQQAAEESKNARQAEKRAIEEANKARAAEADVKSRSRELEQAYVVANGLREVHDELRWGIIQHKLLKIEPTQVTTSESARIEVLRGVTQFRMRRPLEAAESFKLALATWHDAWDDDRVADLITLEVASFGIHALVRSGMIVSKDQCHEMIQGMLNAWRAIDDKYPDDYDRFGVLLAGEALTYLGEDHSAEPLIRESERHLGETQRYHHWHARSVEALKGLLARTDRSVEASELVIPEHPASMARNRAADAAKLIADGSLVEAMKAIHRSLDVWHTAWDSQPSGADLITLRSVTNSTTELAVAAPESQRSQVANTISMVIEAWVGLGGRYPRDFTHLGLVSAGEALMEIGELAEARRILERAEIALESTPRYSQSYRESIELLTQVTEELGDDEAAEMWARRLRNLTSEDESRQTYPAP